MNNNDIETYTNAWRSWEEKVIRYSHNADSHDSSEVFFESILHYGIDALNEQVTSIHSSEDRDKMISYILFRLNQRLVFDCGGLSAFGFGRSYDSTTLSQGAEMIYSSVIRYIQSTFTDIPNFDPTSLHVSHINKWINDIYADAPEHIPAAEQARDISLDFIKSRLAPLNPLGYIFSARKTESELEIINSIIIGYPPRIQHSIATTISVYIGHELDTVYNEYRWRQSIINGVFRKISDTLNEAGLEFTLAEERPSRTSEYKDYLYWPRFDSIQTLRYSLLAFAEYLKSVRDIPNFTFTELIDHLSTMKAYDALQFAQSIYFKLNPSNHHSSSVPRALPLAHILFFGRENPIAAKFKRWNSLEWQQLERWIVHRKKKLIELMEKEHQNKSNSADTLVSDGLKARQSIRVLSTDKDTVRFMEALKRAGIIEATGPEIVSAFVWKGMI